MEDLHLHHNGSKIFLNLKGEGREKMNTDAKEKWRVGRSRSPERRGAKQGGGSRRGELRGKAGGE